MSDAFDLANTLFLNMRAADAESQKRQTRRPSAFRGMTSSCPTGRATWISSTWRFGELGGELRGDCVYTERSLCLHSYNPTFLLPIHAPPALSPSDLGTAGTATGRQTGTGSAQITLPSISNVAQTPLLGFKPMRLYQMIGLTGQTPLDFFNAYHQGGEGAGKLYSLREARDKIYGPLVVFPEGTTSNGRALLRFGKDVLADVDVPVRRGSVWVTSFR